MKMDFGRKDIMVNYDYGSLYEAIDLHNDHIEKMLNLGKMLFDKCDNTTIIDTFCDAFNGVIGTSILLCCEANSREYEPVWMTTEDFFVVKKDKE